MLLVLLLMVVVISINCCCFYLTVIICLGCSGNTAICHKRQDGSYHDLAFASTQTMTINCKSD